MSEKRQIAVILSILLTGLVVACAPMSVSAPTLQAPAAASAVAPAAAVVAVTPTKPARQQEWDKLVEPAQKEGEIVLPAVEVTTARALAGALKAAYGIRLEVLGGNPAEIAPKIVTERRAGLKLRDIGIIGYSSPLAFLKPAGILDPIDGQFLLPELTDPNEIKKVWRYGLLWADKDHTLLGFTSSVQLQVMINTELVKPGDLKSYVDLLEPKWKGKMAMYDPTAGARGTGLNFVQSVKTLMGWDYIRKLKEQEPILLRDHRQLAEWVARGKYAIGLAIHASQYAEFQRIGAPVAIPALKEGGFITPSGNVLSLMKERPHPNATKLFINWLLTKETQTLYSRVSGYVSARSDVPPEGVALALIPDPQLKYTNVSTEEVQVEMDEVARIAKEIFGVR